MFERHDRQSDSGTTNRNALGAMAIAAIGFLSGCRSTSAMPLKEHLDIAPGKTTPHSIEPASAGFEFSENSSAPATTAEQSQHELFLATQAGVTDQGDLRLRAITYGSVTRGENQFIWDFLGDVNNLDPHDFSSAWFVAGWGRPGGEWYGIVEYERIESGGSADTDTLDVGVRRMFKFDDVPLQGYVDLTTDFRHLEGNLIGSYQVTDDLALSLVHYLSQGEEGWSNYSEPQLSWNFAGNWSLYTRGEILDFDDDGSTWVTGLEYKIAGP